MLFCISLYTLSVFLFSFCRILLLCIFLLLFFLLFGFFAELDGSDKITVQEDELSEAGWFYRSEIPEDRTHLSLTGEMMEQFRKGLA